jgi:hypothetical protein
MRSRPSLLVGRLAAFTLQWHLPLESLHRAQGTNYLLRHRDFR